MIAQKLDEELFNQLKLLLIIRDLSEEERSLELFEELLCFGDFATTEFTYHLFVNLFGEGIFVEICVYLFNKFGKTL
jgi:hypothetical protein